MLLLDGLAQILEIKHTHTRTHTHTHIDRPFIVLTETKIITYTHTYTLTIRMLSKCEPKKVVQTLVLGRSCYLQILFRRSSRAASLLMSPSVGLKPQTLNPKP